MTLGQLADAVKRFCRRTAIGGNPALRPAAGSAARPVFQGESPITRWTRAGWPPRFPRQPWSGFSPDSARTIAARARRHPETAEDKHDDEEDLPN